MVKKSKRPTWLSRTALVVVLVVLLSLWWALGIRNFASFTDSEEAARYGESFGYVNSLFSGLALIGVVLAIVLQRQELSLQREELILTRRELKKGAEAQKQLVHLNALSTLLQTHLEEYRRDIKHHEEEYLRLIKYDLSRAEQHICFRIEVLRAQLESIFAEASGIPTGSPVIMQIASMRERRWIDMLRKAATQFAQSWTGAKGQIGNARRGTPPRVILELFGKALRELEGWRNPRCHLSEDAKAEIDSIWRSVIEIENQLHRSPVLTEMQHDAGVVLGTRALELLEKMKVTRDAKTFGQ